MIARIGKWVGKILLLLIAMCIFLFAALAFVLNTEAGTRWTLTRLDNALPGKLDAAEFDGTVWRGLRFAKFAYTDEAQEIKVENLDVSLHWPSLITGRVTVQNLSATSAAHLNLRPPVTEPTPFEIAMRPLPVSLMIRNASIGEFISTNGGSERVIRRIALANLRVVGNELRVANATAAMEPLSASISKFSMALAGVVPTSADVSWRLEDGSGSGRGSVRGSLAQLEFRQDVSGDYAATVSGTLQILDRIEPEFDAAIEWGGWLVGGRELLDGKVRLAGIASRYDASYATTFVLDEQRRYQLTGTANGNTEGLSEFATRITGPEGVMDLNGNMAWRPELLVNATVRSTNIDPSLFHNELAGRLNLSADLSLDQTGVMTIGRLELVGILNDAPLRAGGKLQVSAERQQCSQCTLRVGDNRISFDASNAADELSLSLALNAPALGQLWPGLAGTAVGKAQIDGSIDSPRVNSDLTLENLSYQDTEFGNFVVSLRGTPGQAEVDADWRYQDLGVRADGSVRFDGQLIAGVIREATISKDDLGTWDLKDSFSLRVLGGDLSLDANEWNGDLGNIRISQFSLAGDTIRAVAAVRDLPLALGNRLLPQNYQLSGLGRADIDLTRQSGTWDGTFNWTQADTALGITEANGEVTNVLVPRAEVDVILRDGGVAANATIGIDPGVSAELYVKLEQLDFDAPMTGRLRLQGDDWSWISAVVPQIDRFEGAITTALSATGPLNAPALSGTAEWHDGRLVVPSLNVPLDEISVVIEGAPDGNATIKGSAKAGDGLLQISGQFQDLMQSSRSARFTINGEGAELVNWPEYRVWASPDLELSGDSAAWQVAGQLEVPRAEISLRETPVGAVTISPDVVVLGEENGVTRRTLITGETRLLLGDRVHFEALGLDTRLVGNVLFKMADGRPIRAEGKLSLVDGTYAAQGQKLKIEQGELIFTGPLDDPLVDVRAVRVVETFDGSVTAGIHLRGRAQNLTTSVYSDPAMADADALSYLIIGRPLNQATESDGGELSGAAIALGLQQASQITDQIGQELGLDQLSVAGDGGETTALVAGKQINSRLHARYAYGVFSRLGTLLLRYKMSRNLVLETGAGENQSIDILYTIEK